jgi:hypothetical protein
MALKTLLKRLARPPLKSPVPHEKADASPKAGPDSISALPPPKPHPG